MAKLNKQELVKWTLVADQQRRELEALKIEVTEGRQVSPQEQWTLGMNLFTLTPAIEYRSEKLADLINSHPAEARAAMQQWRVLTDLIQQWQTESISARLKKHPFEAMILRFMLAAMISGDFVRIRTCIWCGKVFIACKSTNQFHSDECRKRFHHKVEVKQPGYLEKHAAKAKKRRHDAKLRAIAEREAAYARGLVDGKQGKQKK
jgi:hypothetical protein